MSPSLSSVGGRPSSECELARLVEKNSADFEQSRIALIASARRLLAAGFGPRNLLLADSADFEQSRIALIASARRLLAAGFGPRNLLLADNGENRAEPLVLDNLGLRDLPQLVKGAVSQLDTFVADRQPAIGIIEHGH